MTDLVCCLTNENKEFQYDVLKSIINTPELLDVPIVIYSIAGPTNTGKSYLLNILWYLLKNQVTEANQVESEHRQIPQHFLSKFSSKSQTDGIHMTKEPIFLFTSSGAQIAVFLMDTEGCQAGDKIECKEGDHFIISLTLSHMQIINVMNNLKYPDIDTYAALTLHTDGTCALRQHTKNLTVLVRDWRYIQEYDHGSEGGNKYFQSFSDNSDYKLQLECLNLFYDKKECFLMPCPGDQVENSDSKRMKDIHQRAWLKLMELKNNLFSSSNIQRAFEIAPKGKEFLAIACQLKETLSSPSRLEAPESSFKNFFDLAMRKKVTACLENYKKNMKQFLLMDGTNKNDLEVIDEEERSDATESLLGNALVEDLSTYVEMLRQHIDGQRECLVDYAMEKKVSRCFKNYKDSMTKKTFDNGNDFETKSMIESSATKKTLNQENLVDDITPYTRMLQQRIVEENKKLLNSVIEKQVENCFERYKSLMEDFIQSCPELKVEDIFNKHAENSNRTTSQLKRDNPINKCSPYVDKLENKIFSQYEIYIGRQKARDFANEWAKNVNQKGNFKVDRISPFYLKEGQKYIREIFARIRDENSQREVIEEFIDMMEEKFYEEVERRTGHTKRTIVAAAAMGGLFSGGLLVFIPALGAAAAASVLATEVAGGLIAGGLGAAGAAATAVPTWLYQRFLNRQDVVPPDLREYMEEQLTHRNKANNNEFKIETQAATAEDENHFQAHKGSDREPLLR